MYNNDSMGIVYIFFVTKFIGRVETRDRDY